MKKEPTKKMIDSVSNVSEKYFAKKAADYVTDVSIKECPTCGRTSTVVDLSRCPFCNPEDNTKERKSPLAEPDTKWEEELQELLVKHPCKFGYDCFELDNCKEYPAIIKFISHLLDQAYSNGKRDGASQVRTELEELITDKKAVYDLCWEKARTAKIGSMCMGKSMACDDLLTDLKKEDK